MKAITECLMVPVVAFFRRLLADEKRSQSLTYI
jgi:hypothetical protein